MPAAMYPGTFDPFSLGHLDIATRAAKIFDVLTVAIYDLPFKKMLFTTEDRVEMAREAIGHLPNVDCEHTLSRPLYPYWHCEKNSIGSKMANRSQWSF